MFIIHKATLGEASAVPSQPFSVVLCCTYKLADDVGGVPVNRVEAVAHQMLYSIAGALVSCGWLIPTRHISAPPRSGETTISCGHVHEQLLQSIAAVRYAVTCIGGA